MSHIIDQAAEFVRRRGSPADVGRLDYVLFGDPVSDTARSDAFAGQREDGGWPPFWAPTYSSLDATCYRLAQAEQMGIGASDDAVRRAMRFLVGRQLPSGYWQEDLSVAALAPPWAAPGKDETRAYLTANCGFWLAVLGVLADEQRAAGRAAEALASDITPDARLQGFTHVNWLAAGLWRLTDHGDLANRSEQWLEQRVRDGLPSGALTWLLSTLRVAGASPASRLVLVGVAQLATQQRMDGGWLSEDGPEREPHVTLEAMRALLWVERGVSGGC